MTDKKQNLTKAYHAMLERVKQVIDEGIDDKTLEEAFEHAKETAHRLGEVTQEEAEQTLSYLKRDLAHAGHYLEEIGTGLQNWIQFDVTLLESKMWDNFQKVADKTLIDMQRLNYRLARGPAYKTGEIIGVGSLQCDNCGEILHFNDASHIPPCPKCHQSIFSRI